MTSKRGIIALCSILLFSCASNIDNTQRSALVNYSKESLEKSIRANVTDKRDILMMFGAPPKNENYNDSSNWVYHSKIIDRSIFLFVPIFRDKEQFLSINFTEAGLVKDYVYTEID